MGSSKQVFVQFLKVIIVKKGEISSLLIENITDVIRKVIKTTYNILHRMKNHICTHIGTRCQNANAANATHLLWCKFMCQLDINKVSDD